MPEQDTVMGTCTICGEPVKAMQWINISGDGETTSAYHLKCYQDVTPITPTEQE